MRSRGFGESGQRQYEFLTLLKKWAIALVFIGGNQDEKRTKLSNGFRNDVIR